MTELPTVPATAPTGQTPGRTACACFNCAISCRHVPGFLAPEDILPLYRLTAGAAAAPGDDAVLAWARRHLRASPGAVVGKRRDDGSLHTFRVPTLVPARAAGGCHWLDAAQGDGLGNGVGGCAVHAAAPWGCRMTDSHMEPALGRRKSHEGLMAVIVAWVTARDRPESPAGLYARLWVSLEAEGLTAPGPEESRRGLAAAIGGLYPENTPYAPAGPETPGG